MSDYKTIAESKNFIVLDQYTKDWQANESYQSEDALERELIALRFFARCLISSRRNAPQELRHERR